jgi:hypothetical protein
MKLKGKALKEVNKEIREIDDSISLIRTNWLTCSEKNKSKYMKLIDRMLDERLICMAKRDGKQNATAA